MLKKTRAKIKETVSGKAAIVYAEQIRPNTFVKLSHDGYYGIGFAKVCSGDKWDSQYGYDLARKKAVAHIVRQILGKSARY